MFYIIQQPQNLDQLHTLWKALLGLWEEKNGFIINLFTCKMTVLRALSNMLSSSHSLYILYF